MLDHGVNRQVVRGARERAGAPPLPRGRRRKAATTSVGQPAAKPRIAKITERRNQDKQAGEVPRRELVLSHFLAWDRAVKDRNLTGQINALEAIAATAWNLADQLEQVQAA